MEKINIMKKIVLGLFALSAMIACKNKPETENTAQALNEITETVTPPSKSTFKVTPISHATMVIQWDEVTIYVDPVGGPAAFEGQPAPDLILVTDIHGDHLNVETLRALIQPETQVIVPMAVAEKIPNGVSEQLMVMNNDQVNEVKGISIEAIPMYNLRTEALKFHEKGRGNGYVISKNEERVYLSGDTEDIPEMRALTNIDKAFVCMNLPYTMTVESAADGVLAFAPKEVFPYHYRGTEGLSDVAKFKELVNAGNEKITVTQLDWYPTKE